MHSSSFTVLKGQGGLHPSSTWVPCPGLHSSPWPAAAVPDSTRHQNRTETSPLLNPEQCVPECVPARTRGDRDQGLRADRWSGHGCGSRRPFSLAGQGVSPPPAVGWVGLESLGAAPKGPPAPWLFPLLAPEQVRGQHWQRTSSPGERQVGTGLLWSLQGAEPHRKESCLDSTLPGAGQTRRQASPARHAGTWKCTTESMYSVPTNAPGTVL